MPENQHVERAALNQIRRNVGYVNNVHLKADAYSRGVVNFLVNAQANSNAWQKKGGSSFARVYRTALRHAVEEIKQKLATLKGALKIQETLLVKLQARALFLNIDLDTRIDVIREWMHRGTLLGTYPTSSNVAREFLRYAEMAVKDEVKEVERVTHGRPSMPPFQARLLQYDHQLLEVLHAARLHFGV